MTSPATSAAKAENGWQFTAGIYVFSFINACSTP
jgi:hypothetical protein